MKKSSFFSTYLIFEKFCRPFKLDKSFPSGLGKNFQVVILDRPLWIFTAFETKWKRKDGSETIDIISVLGYHHEKYFL